MLSLSKTPSEAVSEDVRYSLLLVLLPAFFAVLLAASAYLLACSLLQPVTSEAIIDDGDTVRCVTRPRPLFFYPFEI